MAKCVDCEKIPENFEDAITKTGFGKFNIFVLLIGGGCVLAVILETMGMMFVIPSAVCDLELDLTAKGVLASISFLGVFSSSHLWGFLADTKGRKNVLLISMTVGFATSLLSSVAPSAWSFILIRYFNGFFIGGASAVVYAYVGEFHNSYYRPKIVLWTGTFFALGNSLLPAISWAVLPLDFKITWFLGEFRPWRLLVICIGSPSLLVAIGLYFLPESPKLLLSLDKSEEALDALRIIYRWNTGKSADSFPVSRIIWCEEGAEEKYRKVGVFKAALYQSVVLFKSPYLVKTAMVCLLQFGAFASSSGLFMWYPEILNNIGRYSNNSRLCQSLNHHIQDDDPTSKASICSDAVDDSVYESSLIFGAVLVVVYVLVGAIITKVGAKSLLMLFLLFTASCGIAAQLIHINLAIKILLGFFLLATTCIGIINTLVVELYPTHTRGMALAISLMAGRLGAVAGSHITGQLIYKLCDYTFYIFGVDHLVLTITTFLLPTAPHVQKMIQPLT